MINPTRYLFVVFILLGCTAFHIAASAQTTPKKASPTGSISGRVTLQGKGKPGIIVGLSAGPGGGPVGPIATPGPKAITDADGNYRITEIPAGFYRVLPIAPEFVVLDVEMNPYASRGKGLQLAEGESVADINFEIQRGAVITGKVTHADGRPVVEERVIVAPQESQDRTGRQYLQSSPTFTDDRGIYRIYGLLPGKYKVSVGQADDAFFATVNRGRAAFERVFYPDASDVNDAKIVDVSEGGEATNIDITIGKKILGYAVTGLVVDGETNLPLPNIRFSLRKVMGQDNRSSMTMGAISTQQGEFRIDNVPPGKYSLLIAPQFNNQVQGDAVPFEVIDQDVTGLTLRTSRGGASMSGTVVVEGTSDKSVLAKLGAFRLQVFMRPEGNIGGGSFAVQRYVINPDGSFRIAALQPGTAMFSLLSIDSGPPKGFSFSRVERDGIVQQRGLEVKQGEQVSGVRVVFTYATGVIRGSLNVENGPIPAGARVMAWITRPGDPSFRLSPREVDSRGHFVIEGVPAGTYDLRVSVYIQNSRQPAPSAHQAVTVTDGATTEAVLSLDLNPRRDVPNQ